VQVSKEIERGRVRERRRERVRGRERERERERRVCVNPFLCGGGVWLCPALVDRIFVVVSSHALS
jgi:hypothetical protein